MKSSMSTEEAQEFTVGIGQICSGTWRIMMVAVRQGVPEALGMTPKELANYGMNQCQIGDVLGVHRETVRRDAANAAKTTDNAKNGDAVNPSKTNGEEPDCDGNPPKTEKRKGLEEKRDGRKEKRGVASGCARSG
jgi:hypothetical protein